MAEQRPFQPMAAKKFTREQRKLLALREAPDAVTTIVRSRRRTSTGTVTVTARQDSVHSLEEYKAIADELRLKGK
jgi:hypothetical protein